MESPKSFYDLDYLIELSEKRLEQYNAANQTLFARLTNIVLLYSLFGIYLIPLIRDMYEIHSWLFMIVLLVMLVLSLASAIYTIRLMWPADLSQLAIISEYYGELRYRYEEQAIGPDMPADMVEETRRAINHLLKASYLDELDKAQTNNQAILSTKSHHYYKAMRFALVATLPYVICVSFHITKKEPDLPKELYSYTIYSLYLSPDKSLLI